MNRLFPLFLGPELIWIFLYVLIFASVKFSGAPVKSMDSTWISLAYIVPLIFIPLSFGLYYVPGVIRSWLLLRIILSGFVGCHFLLDYGLKAHSEQGPGVGTAYIVGMLLAFVVLFIGSIWAMIKF